jgi:hypothetical protein
MRYDNTRIRFFGGHRSGSLRVGVVQTSTGTVIPGADGIREMPISLYAGSCIQSLLTAICASRGKGVMCDGLE